MVLSDGVAHFFAFGLTLLIIGIIAVLWGFKSLKMKNLLENTPTSKIRSIAMGPVEVYGEAIARQLVKAPMSNTDCLYYKYLVEERVRSRRSSHWVTVKSGEEKPRFYLKDETGWILVDPEGAEIEILEDFQWSSGVLNEPPENIRAFLKTQGLSSEGFLGINKTMRYTEYIIKSGDKLYIFGNAGDNPEVEEGAAQNHEADVMIGKGELFYISDSSEKDLLSKFRTTSSLGLIGGSISIIMGLCLAFLGAGML